MSIGPRRIDSRWSSAYPYEWIIRLDRRLAKCLQRVSCVQPQEVQLSVERSIDSRIGAWVAPSAPLEDTARLFGFARGANWYSRFHRLLIASDAIAVASAVAISYLVRFGAPELGLANESAWDVIVVTAVWLLAMSTAGSRDQRVLAAGLEEYKRVMAGCLQAFGILAIGSYLLRAELPRSYFVIALPLGTIFLLVLRWVARLRLSNSRLRGKHLMPTIVVGSVDETTHVVHQLRRRREFGLTPTAMCLVGPHSARTSPEDARLPQVSLRQIPDLVASGAYRSVVVSGEGLSTEQLRDLVWGLERSHTSVILASSIMDAVGHRLSGWTLQAKRLFDVVFSALALLFLTPVLLVIAVAIFLDDPGPIIFRQQRVGLRGKPFTIHKFRSMAVDAEARLEALRSQSTGNGPLFKMDADPRITPVGRVLRKYSLDELPQFWTVLRGRMSVVGPRPHLERELDEFPDVGLRRLLIKPGITGLWQVSGRSDLNLEDSMKLDLRYVQNWSLLGDVAIVLKTIKAMISPQGAY